MAYDSRNYRKEYQQVEGDVTWAGKRLIWKLVLLVIVLSAVGFGLKLLFTPAALIEKATDPDAIISNYEEFQNMWNACQKLDADLKTLCSTPDSDPQFNQFSKASLAYGKRGPSHPLCNIQRRWQSCDITSTNSYARVNCKRCRKMLGLISMKDAVT
jgi:hypothetical protein